MNKKIILGIDIGGSHISCALVNVTDNEIIDETFVRERVDSDAKAEIIIEKWIGAINKSLYENNMKLDVNGIAIAMPGPFLYKEGVSLIQGIDKYDRLYGINIRRAIESGLPIRDNVPVIFVNDAACFALATSISDKVRAFRRVIAITLGTGFGSAFIKDKKVVEASLEMPYAGTLYKTPFKGGIAEDYVSSRWIINTYEELTGEKTETKEVARRALEKNDEHAKEIFKCLGRNLAEILIPHIRSFKSDCITIGGNIALASPLFLPSFESALLQQDIGTTVIISANTEKAAITGAAFLLTQKQSMKDNLIQTHHWRKSSQPILPSSVTTEKMDKGSYNIYPFIKLENGQILRGYASLAKWMTQHRKVIIDGFVGNDWPFIMKELHEALIDQSINELWFEMSAFEKPEQEIEKMVMPFLGKEDSPWGRKTTISIEDFYDMEKLSEVQPSEKHDISIVAGTGAALCGWNAPIIYIDLPKNELQYRMRAASVTNLGKKMPEVSEAMYKRFYFVDWVVLNKHRQQIKDKIRVVADGQWRQDISWTTIEAVNSGFNDALKSAFRPRPWFEAGAWGGQWLKHHIKGLPKQEINYAWSFELITPENGIILESDGKLLELAFDWIMEYDAKAVLGTDVERFGTAFPIRFDFLDTMDGGNLSIQCHPRLSYIQEHFGEHITQDETYYMLDCEKNAGVYLGFQDTIKPDQFRQELERSLEDNVPVEIENFVQKFPSHKHDLFLIPNGTIHSSGAGNLVLEISATPYIFTFKMYDWLRLDLNNKPRPINIDHAFNNLNFERKGTRVEEDLVSKPVLIEKGNGYRVIHLPTHAEHFYDVHRIEFEKQVIIETKGKCHVMMLVEGSSVLVKTHNGKVKRFNYAETFIIPASAGSYELANEGTQTAKVIKAFIK